MVGAPLQNYYYYYYYYYFEPLAPPQRKKMDPPGYMISHLIGCMEILFPKQNCLLPFFSWANRCVVVPPPPPCLPFGRITFGYQTCEAANQKIITKLCLSRHASRMNEWMTKLSSVFWDSFVCVLAANVSTTYLVWPRFLFRSTCWLHWLSLSLSLPIYIYSSPVSLLNVLSGTRQKKQPQSLSMSLWN